MWQILLHSNDFRKQEPTKLQAFLVVGNCVNQSYCSTSIANCLLNKIHIR